ncbi:MAG: alkaline phosphatase family protein, partial [Mycobacteriales bacterium]
VLVLAGCAQPTPRPQAVPSSPAATTSTGAAALSSTSPTTRPITRPTKLLVIVEENHGQSQALRSMPYLASLGRRYGRTTGYRAVAHPSLPNYLALAGGSTFGVVDDRGPSAHPLAGASVFGQALARHRTAKSYVESMPSPCSTSTTSRYAVKHNPWAYFAAERAACRRFDVPAGTPAGGALRADVDAGRLPTVGMVVPDICDDGHSCSLETADAWLRGWLPVLMEGPDFRAGRLAVVVTFDEDDHGEHNTVLTVVLAPGLHGSTVGTSLSHRSLSRWASELSGAPPLRDAVTATSLGRAFGLQR